MRVVRSPRRIATALLGVVALLATLLAVAEPAHAASDSGSGASSRVVGRGDIVTSIIGWRLGSSANRRSGRPVRCRWVTLQDVQIEWLAAASASWIGSDGVHPVLDTVRAHLGGDELPDGDLQARVCDRVAVDLRFVPRTEPADAVEVLHRRMITRLPVPDPVWSPTAEVAVPVHQPIFASIPTDQWVPVTSTITVDGLSAQVRATPVSVRVISGDPTQPGVAPCPGPGRPFDPADATSVRAQAQRDDTCALTYRSTTATGWIGTVTVLWHAEWRVVGDGGDGGWASLGTIPRTRLFARTVREVHTAIESTDR